MDQGLESDEPRRVSGAGGKNGRGVMQALELEQEEETDSLMKESSDHAKKVSKNNNNNNNNKTLLDQTGGGMFRKRAGVATATQPSSSSPRSSGGVRHFLGQMRSTIGTSAALRHFVVLLVLSFCIVAWLRLDLMVVTQTPQKFSKREPHASSFGGSNNPGHYDVYKNMVDDDDAGRGLYDDDMNLMYDDDYLIKTVRNKNDDATSGNLPKDNVGSAVKSKSPENKDNFNGHYLHDPFRSPFASPLYADLTAEQRTDIQKTFDEKRQSVIDQFGVYQAPEYDSLSTPQFALDSHKDLPLTSFPETAWHRDTNYTIQFLTQAKNLVRRVQDAILLEYGKDPTSEEDWKDFKVIFETVPNFATMNGQAVDKTTQQPLRGVAFLNTIAWEGLVRKLLHALMTHDDFYVVAVGGPGAYTYQGNMFSRTQVMRFNEIMEPVFDKLGVSLVSRNMGMDASTTLSALAGADIYGEADVFWYIADARSENEANPENEGQLDLLLRQTILSGQRMPVILTPNPVALAKDAKGKAWIGNIQQNHVCPVTTYDGTNVVLPPAKACHYVVCDEAAQEKRLCDVYESTCWVKRADWNPSAELGDTPQQATPGHESENFPNSRQHQWEGRKLALVVLEALQEAIKRWTDEANANQLPLAENLWHVRSVYEELREEIRSLARTPGETAVPPPCETLLASIDPMICHMEMHGLTDFSPRANPFIGVHHVVVGDFADNSEGLVALYKGVDLLPQQWQLSKEDVDVHMVAIVTNESIEPDEEVPSLENSTFGFDDDFQFDGDFGDLDDYTMFDDEYRGRSLTEKETRRRRQLRRSNNNRGFLRKQEQNHRLLPGQVAHTKWTLWERPIGFCDGSAQSMCNRRIGNKCLLQNNNFYKAGFVGHGNSEWLELSLPLVEGIVLLRFEWNLDLTTGEQIPDSESFLTNLPDDLVFEVDADDNKVTYTKTEFLDLGKKIADDLIVHPVYINKEMESTEGEHEELSLNIRFKTKAGEDFKVLLTHVYYA